MRDKKKQKKKTVEQDFFLNFSLFFTKNIKNLHIFSTSVEKPTERERERNDDADDDFNDDSDDDENDREPGGASYSSSSFLHAEAAESAP